MTYTPILHTLCEVVTVNALKVRNQFGEILEQLDEGNSPILIEKRKKVRAVLISYEDYKTRFLDKQIEDERERFLLQVEENRRPSRHGVDPIRYLRSLRGYED